MEKEKKVKRSVAREKRQRSARSEKMKLRRSDGSEKSAKRNEMIKALWRLLKVKDRVISVLEFLSTKNNDYGLFKEYDLSDENLSYFHAVIFNFLV